MAIEVFNRVEKKYIINDDIYYKLTEQLEEFMIEDEFCIGDKFYSISNIYFDTLDNELIRRSIEKPQYKEKLRLRSYGVPNLNDKVFLEIKKKHKGIVNKRRTIMQLNEAYDFMLHNKIPKNSPYINEQVLKELKYFNQLYKPIPKLYLAYERKALIGKDNSDLRITFDKNIRTRRESLFLELGNHGEPLLPKGIWLMEIKAIGSMPIWLSKMLTKLEVKASSFSKYGTEYKKFMTTKSGGTEN